MKSGVSLSDLPTYVYIDSSNIRFACSCGLGIDLDYEKLYKYLRGKYPSLEKVLYFEGSEVDDLKKRADFKRYQKLGYEVKILERKKYTVPAVFRYRKCPNCKKRVRICACPKSVKLKPNVDVFLCSEMVSDALREKRPAHFIYCLVTEIMLK